MTTRNLWSMDWVRIHIFSKGLVECQGQDAFCWSCS